MARTVRRQSATKEAKAWERRMELLRIASEVGGSDGLPEDIIKLAARMEDFVVRGVTPKAEVATLTLMPPSSKVPVPAAGNDTDTKYTLTTKVPQTDTKYTLTT